MNRRQILTGAASAALVNYVAPVIAAAAPPRPAKIWRCLDDTPGSQDMLETNGGVLFGRTNPAFPPQRLVDLSVERIGFFFRTPIEGDKIWVWLDPTTALGDYVRWNYRSFPHTKRIILSW